MNLVPRIEGSKLIIFDANSVTITIHPKNGGKDKIRVYDAKKATLKREINL